MVGIVIVSHSAALAQGVEELARGMAGPDVRLKAVGGLNLPGQPLGTDAQLVLEAIQEVYSPEGVLVLMDLGSALLSAEVAVEQLTPEQRRHVALCDAPLVEGAVAAAVQARIGSPLAHVLAEARNALAAKTAHIESAAAPTSEPPVTATAADIVRLRVRNRLGLHARPAARFVQTAARFNAEITVANLSAARGPVNAKSINAVATLGVQQSQEIQISASGPEAQAALAALCALAANNFGDTDEVPAQSVQAPPVSPARIENSSKGLQGLAASPGVAVGLARRLGAVSALPAIPIYTVTDPSAEWKSFLTALEQTRTQIQATRDAVARRTNHDLADLFEAHLLFLDDEALREPVYKAIFDDKINAATAWDKTVARVADQYRHLETEYFRARASDVAEVGQQVLVNLLQKDEKRPAPQLSEPGILVADDLSSAETVGLDPKFVLGICTTFGSATSHSAILARMFGIPAVTGLGDRLRAVADGAALIVDGDNGQVWLWPDSDLESEYARRAEAARAEQAQAQAVSQAPAVTRDGRRVEVAANIGSVADARVAVASGAEGVGLLRTEFLFLDRQTAPDEDEQYAAYRAIAQALAGRPLIIRTLDIGGDKPVPYLNLGGEANPFLGWRAIRICLAQPELFKSQLRAILRTAAEFPVKIMYPMIATVGEWRAAQALLTEARGEARQQGHAVPDQIETGIMVEIPSAALQAEKFATEVDFFSIGTNDLTQYTLAAERGNANVAALADALQPAVLKLIAHTVKAAQAHQKWVGVCGELAGDPAAVPLLVGLGVDELSMNAPAIPRAKQIIRALDGAAMRARAQAALELDTVEAVRAAFGRPQ
jgi:phosphocarrier protein FPr